MAALALYDRIALEPHKKQEIIAGAWRSKKYKEPTTEPIPDDEGLEKLLEDPQGMDDAVQEQGDPKDGPKPGPPAPYAERVAESEAQSAQ